MKNCHRSIQGFSLIELIVTIGIMGILASVAVPSYQSYMANNRATVYSNQLLADLRYAKNLATVENAAVTICQSGTITTQQLSCTNIFKRHCSVITSQSPVCNDSIKCCDNTSTSWQKGWFVFSSTTNTPRRNFQFNSALMANTNAGITVSGTQPLVFKNNGLASGAYTFTITPLGCSEGYTISVESDGTINRTSTPCS